MGQAARRSLPPLLCSISLAWVNVSESDRETATVNIVGSERAGITPQNFNDENDEGPLDFCGRQWYTSCLRQTHIMSYGMVPPVISWFINPISYLGGPILYQIISSHICAAVTCIGKLQGVLWLKAFWKSSEGVCLTSTADFMTTSPCKSFKEWYFDMYVYNYNYNLDCARSSRNYSAIRGLYPRFGSKLKQILSARIPKYKHEWFPHPNQAKKEIYGATTEI